MEFDAIVLAGGRGSRLGGVDKGAMVYNQATLLGRALSAVSPARKVVVVGGRAPEGVLHTVEDPAGAGPAAAVRAGLAKLGEPAGHVAVVACDVPEVEAAFARLREAGGSVVAVDADGRVQYLLAIYPSTPLLARAQTDLRGCSMRALVDGVELQEVLVDAKDVDTPEDAERFGITL